MLELLVSVHYASRTHTLGHYSCSRATFYDFYRHYIFSLLGDAVPGFGVLTKQGITELGNGSTHAGFVNAPACDLLGFSEPVLSGILASTGISGCVR